MSGDLMLSKITIILTLVLLFPTAQAFSQESDDGGSPFVVCLPSGECFDPATGLISLRCTSRGLTPACTKWCILFQRAMEDVFALCIQPEFPSYDCINAKSAERSYARLFNNCLHNESRRVRED